MKRWQDRGEVADSDEEELDLDLSIESPTEEPPQKRPKLSQELGSTQYVSRTLSEEPKNSRLSDDEDEIAWLPAKVAKTYGRKGKLVRANARAQASRPVPIEPEVSDKLVPMIPAPLDTTIYETIEEPSDSSTPRDGNQIEDKRESIPVSSIGPQTARRSIAANDAANTSHSSDEDELPDLKDIFSASRQINPNPPSRGESSPLSERSISPPSDLHLWTRESRVAQAEAVQATPVSITAAETENDPVEDFNVVEIDAVTGRRSLRARKDIQLHPYLLEKAKYQKQFKERGLKPVRLVQPDQPENEESQSLPSSGQTAVFSSSPVSNGRHTTPERSAAPQHSYNQVHSSHSTGQDLAGQHRFPKRRKFIHYENAADRLTRTSGLPLPPADTFSVPPSPPHTSSSANSPAPLSHRIHQTTSGFRYLAGLTPQPLPTPAVSSEVKRAFGDESSSSESPPRTARRPRLARVDSTLVANSSSEAESEAEIEARRLRRERKRIRGVLPASWLKIDMQKQNTRRSNSPITQHRSTTKSPERLEYQKGVAKRVNGRQPRSSGIDEPLMISDGEDSGDSLQVNGAAQEQAMLELDRHRLSFAPTATVDDDAMENDFVDAMLAGPSRHSKQRRREQSHQPRITAAFGRRTEHRDDFAEERSLHRKATGALESHNGSGNRHSRKSHKPSRSPHVRLSIVDAPSSPAHKDAALPHFVRLALRQCRRTSNQGRHTPTGKFIRLATREDTAEANSVLKSWRQGTIVPRHEPDRGDADSVKESTTIHSAAGDLAQRFPLSELSDNARQAKFPTPVRKTAVSHRSSSKPGSHRAKKTRLQQTRLSYDVVAPELQFDDVLRQPQSAGLSRTHRQSKAPRRQPMLRNAQLETLQREFDHDYREQLFARRMQCLTENVALPGRRVQPSEFQLARYLLDETQQHAIPTTEDQPDAPISPHHSNEGVILPHRPRKFRAQRLDAEAAEYRQSGELIDSISPERDDEQRPATLSGPVLQGLGPFGTRYPLHFDVQVLHSDTFFQRDTLIGSGEFHDALNLPQHSLDQSRGQMHVRFGDRTREWSVWNEDTAADFSRVALELSNTLKILDNAPAGTEMEQIRHSIDQSVEYFLRSVVRYCSKCVYFADSVDRQTCAESLCRLVDELADIVVERQTESCQVVTTLIRIRQYMVIAAAQAKQVADHPAVSQVIKERTSTALRNAASSLIEHVIADRFEDLRADYEKAWITSLREEGVPENAWALNSTVILNNALQKLETDAALWDVSSSAFPANVNEYCVVGDFERQWRNLFTMLPALEVDSSGRIQHSARSRSPEAWAIPRHLMHRIFELYESSSKVRGYTVNDYLRILLSRCHHLLASWRWWRCEPILNIIYDFFASRSLGFLRNEESRGSLRFLEELDSQPSLEILPNDRSFHIFLKLLATALLKMRDHHVYEGRKIGGLIWRFIPSHGRTYKKDMDLNQIDLDALQNHHDLLVTLYYALPPGQRPKISLVRDLVDHDKSHRKACDVNVKSWANLSNFQSSINEPLDAMQPLCEWFVDIMRATLAQFRLAKSEAEQDFVRAKSQGANVAESLLQATIANNQRLIAATIVSGLAGLKQALSSASSASMVQYIIESTKFWTVLDLFDPSQRRLLSTMTEALRVVDAALEKEAQLSTASESQSMSDDSQEFGDFSALQEFAAHDNSATTVADILLVPVGHFLSNVFGADTVPDDSLLERVVDVWVKIANRLVKTSKKSWASFVDEYSTQSWSQMRDTTQWRKFTPYFMARVIQEQSADRQEAVRQKVLHAWILSLVEREASLKFQHTLTTALLNHCSDEPLLRNLPFSQDKDGQFHIRLDELRQRRLALLSSLLSNMRESLNEALYDRKRPVQDVRNSHATLLRQMMQEMKRHYQELQGDKDADVADGAAQGSYVEFVQHVVSFLQQHTGDICKVDPFFTDSNAFPLPARDPTYVVGKLKRYSPKLCEAKYRKELAVEQLFAAMGSSAESDHVQKPSLLHVLTTSIFPAYVDSSLGTACGWILALPILDACKQTFADVIYNIQLEDDNSVLAAISSVTAVLHSINRQCQLALAHTGLLGISNVMHVLAAMFSVCSSTLSTASSIQRATPHAHDLLQLLRALHTQACKIGQQLDGAVDVDYLENPHTPAKDLHPWIDTEEFVKKQVHESLNNWQAVDGQYFVRRGYTSKEVVVHLNSANEERMKLHQVIASFKEKYQAIFSPRQRRKQVELTDACELSSLLI